MIGGGLFTRDFLIEGIAGTPQWTALDDASGAGMRRTAEALFKTLVAIKTPSEAVTEKDLIYPLLKSIAWGDLV